MRFPKVGQVLLQAAVLPPFLPLKQNVALYTVAIVVTKKMYNSPNIKSDL